MVWVEKLDLKVAPDIEVYDGGADPVLELLKTMKASAGSEAFRAEARALIERTVGDLPPEARDFAGRDEAGLLEFLERVMSEGADLVAARLKDQGVQ